MSCSGRGPLRVPIVSAFLLALPTLLPGARRSAGPAPVVYCYDLHAFAMAREMAARGDPLTVAALHHLAHDADRALRTPAMSIMLKRHVPPSGDMHDYLSQGPYWWPDPSKPDGLPYLRKDGQRNPESSRGYDNSAWGRTSADIITLGLAYAFTGRVPYAERAAALARTWFLDPATRMNPNLQFAQFVPGRNKGRGIGIIEFRSLPEVCDALTLISSSRAWSASDQRQLRDWLARYRDWLLASPNGRQESAERNNHGTWYAVQSAYLDLYLGHPSLAHAVLERALHDRVPRQIEPDGRQPLELQRTRSLSYSLFNLEALFALAELGGHAGVDFWHVATPDHRSLDAAVSFIAPYADPKRPWIRHDIAPAGRGRIVALLAQRQTVDDNPRYGALLARFGKSTDARWRLLWARGP